MSVGIRLMDGFLNEVSEADVSGLKEAFLKVLGKIHCNPYHDEKFLASACTCIFLKLRDVNVSKDAVVDKFGIERKKLKKFLRSCGRHFDRKLAHQRKEG